MDTADTPAPGEDPGTLVEDQNDHEPDPATEMDIEVNPQSEPNSSLPPGDDDADAEETGR